MTAYEFYSRDELGELYLIGVLPERRSDQERITDESIINWARSLLGDESGVNNISYSTIRLEKRILMHCTGLHNLPSADQSFFGMFFFYPKG